PAGGLRRAADAYGAQEHELVRIRGTRDRARDRAPNRHLRVRRTGRPGDAALRPQPRGRTAAALEGRGAGLPLLPGTAPRAAGAAARVVARRTRCRARRIAVGAARARSRRGTRAARRRGLERGAGASEPVRDDSRRRYRGEAGGDVRAQRRRPPRGRSGPGRRRRAREGAARARPDPAGGLRRRRRGQRERGLLRRGVPARAHRCRHLGARPGDRPDPERERGAGRGLPRWEGGAARLLRRPGDAGDAGQGESKGRQRAPARKAPNVVSKKSTAVRLKQRRGNRGVTRREKMANRVGWFEVVGQDGEKLRGFYSDVFGWQFNVPSPEMNYGMTEASDTGIGGGIGQAQGGPGHATFYVGVPDPQAALDKIEGAGGKTVVPVTELEMVTFAMFTDPEGHLVGLYKSDE